ncbi:hypothetical protein DNHGIG_32380 [Collibacillus ludicampi]|uniref:Tim44-like domain-containing protein n=1 Tax=Collibacillus ludicampi TaxID=2771369 RepID=A0AAV4LIS6_9BACL|nr:hypothetical protein [Collibacillus ludicampi]GIM47689.1 hypothetical protein DNHGIG_32380 [Collibacillus ludicampi]
MDIWKGLTAGLAAVSVLLTVGYVQEKQAVDQAQKEVTQLQAQVQKGNGRGDSSQGQPNSQNPLDNQAVQAAEQEAVIKAMLKETFQNLFTYDNKNYEHRFDLLQKNAFQNVVKMLKGSGDGSDSLPPLPMKSTVQSVEVYTTVDGADTGHALVNVKSIFTNDEVRSTNLNQLFDVDLKKMGEKWWIEKIAMLQTAQPFTHP